MNTASTPQSIPEIPGVNMPAALARLAGNAKLLLKLFGDFRKQNLETVQQARELMKSGDNETLVRLLHTLKGVSANLAIDGISESAKVAEYAARELDIPRLEAALDALQEGLDVMFQSIEIATAPAPTAAPAPAAQPAAQKEASPFLRQAMTETLRLVNLQSPDATFVFETMRDELQVSHPAQAAAISASLDAYAFADASRQLTALAAALKLV